MKKYILLLLLLFPLSLTAQNFNGRYSFSLYSFERFDTLNSSKTYFRNYQILSLNVNKDKIAFKTRFNFESNMGTQLISDPRLRIYNFYLEARDIMDFATVKFGRQPIFNSVVGGLFDGVELKMKHTDFLFTGYYGGNVPAYQKFEVTSNWKDDYILGAKLESYALEDFRFALSYVDKNFKPQDYFALRLDQDLNPVNMLIRQNSNQYRFISAEASYDKLNFLNVYTRFDYDLNYEKASKFELTAGYDFAENLGANFYYNYREPRVRYNSIFSVFDYGSTQEVEGGLDYKINEDVTVTGKYGYVTYQDENSSRLTLGANSKLGSVSYRKTFGYAGEMDAVSVYTAHSFLDGLITPSLGLSYAGYKLSKDAEKNSVMAFLAGVNYRPYTKLSFDLQAQFYNNKIYANDFRILFKINHWFNTNLDLL